MERLIRLALPLLLALLAGCQGGEESKPETQASQQEAKSAASNWTPEQQKIFAEENKKARSGQDSEPNSMPAGTGK